MLPEISDDQFRTILDTTLTLCQIPNEDAARVFKVSLPTIERWRNGVSLPHQLGRPSVIAWCGKVLELDFTLDTQQTDTVEDKL